MRHWLLDSISEKRIKALREAGKIQIYKQLLDETISEDIHEIIEVANALELVVLDLTLNQLEDDSEEIKTLRSSASDLFDCLALYRCLKSQSKPHATCFVCLH